MDVQFSERERLQDEFIAEVGDSPTADFVSRKKSKAWASRKIVRQILLS
jgi:hypothetical protein